MTRPLLCIFLCTYNSSTPSCQEYEFERCVSLLSYQTEGEQYLTVVFQAVRMRSHCFKWSNWMISAWKSQDLSVVGKEVRSKHGSHWKLGWPWLSRTYHCLFWQVPWFNQHYDCMLFSSILCIWPHISVHGQWLSALQDCLGGFGKVFWRKTFRKSGDMGPR